MNRRQALKALATMVGAAVVTKELEAVLPEQQTYTYEKVAEVAETFWELAKEYPDGSRDYILHINFEAEGQLHEHLEKIQIRCIARRESEGFREEKHEIVNPTALGKVEIPIKVTKGIKT